MAICFIFVALVGSLVNALSHAALVANSVRRQASAAHTCTSSNSPWDVVTGICFCQSGTDYFKVDISSQAARAVFGITGSCVGKPASFPEACPALFSTLTASSEFTSHVISCEKSGYLYFYPAAMVKAV